MGTIIAERRLILYSRAGEKRTVIVRLGAPVMVRFPELRQIAHDSSEPGVYLYRCPVQIDGLDHDGKVFPVGGEDPFVALQYAIDLVGDLLNDGSERLQLESRARFDSSTRDHWVWRFPPNSREVAIG
jgi:hypothetical protein